MTYHAASRSERSAQPVYPIFLTHLASWRVVVVGGGIVATRKIAGLLAAQARPTVIAPQVTAQIAAWQSAGCLEWIARPYAAGDLTDARLVLAATDDRAVNAAVAAEAAAIGGLCNVADDPDRGDFHLPAVHRDPDYIVAVGTGGASPRRAVALRDRLAAWLTESHAKPPRRKEKPEEEN
jgi:cobalt-precorrin 5A hydrolase/precorrin-3B C17-methyltransferase